MNKLNLSVDGREVTAYFSHSPSGPKATCSYCGKRKGNEVEVTIKEVNADGVGIDLNSKFGWQIIAAVQMQMLHGTPVCPDCYGNHFATLEKMEEAD